MPIPWSLAPIPWGSVPIPPGSAPFSWGSLPIPQGSLPISPGSVTITGLKAEPSGLDIKPSGLDADSQGIPGSAPIPLGYPTNIFSRVSYTAAPIPPMSTGKQSVSVPTILQTLLSVKKIKLFCIIR